MPLSNSTGACSRKRNGHRLRTHGGVSEAKVPFILSVPLNDEYKLKAGASTLKSYQIFEYALNGALN